MCFSTSAFGIVERLEQEEEWDGRAKAEGEEAEVVEEEEETAAMSVIWELDGA